MKQYTSSIVEKETPAGKQVCRHMGLVCPLDSMWGMGAWERLSGCGQG